MAGPPLVERGSNLYNYESPFSNRYGSPEMRSIWSEERKRLTWRRVWVALARAEHLAGLVTAEELADLEAHMEDIDVPAALAIETQIGHDLVSEQRVFASQAKIGGRILHLGPTSEDIKGNTDILLMRESVDLIREKTVNLLQLFAGQIELYADTPCLGWTHLQPAEVTTVGYRLANYAQDVLSALKILDFTKEHFLKGKGMKGIVGTGASFASLLRDTQVTPDALEKMVMEDLGFEAFGVTTQVYPRSTDFDLISALNSLAIGPARFANDLTFLQSPLMGEMAEPLKEKGRSSAAPWKRNPERSEKIVSMAKIIADPLNSFSETARELAIERRMTDSASRRVLIPQVLLATDELLERSCEIVGGLVVNQKAIRRNLAKFGPFLGIEPLLMELVKKGGNRLEMHEILREISLQTWGIIEEEEVRPGENPLLEAILGNEDITRTLSEEEIRQLMDISQYVGDAPQRARDFVAEVRDFLGGNA